MSETPRTTGTSRVKRGLAEMLKGGVIMDVVTAEQARIAEDAGAVAVMALERVPADIRAQGGVARMSDPDLIEGIVDAVSIPSTMALDIIKTRGAGKIEVRFAYSLQPNSMAVRRGDFELHQWLNNFIYYVKLNGELDAIARKWSGAPLPALPTF